MSAPFEYTNQLGTQQAPKTSSYGSAADWAQILSSLGQGASNAFSNKPSPYISGKKDAKEVKRRNTANLLSHALQNNQNLSRMGQQHNDEMRDFQSQAMQQMARGFVQALQGST